MDSTTVAAEEALLKDFLAANERAAAEIRAFVLALKRRDLVASLVMAKNTLDLVQVVVGARRQTRVGDVLSLLRALGRRLVRERPSELVVGNMVRRVLFALREEFSRKQLEEIRAAASSDEDSEDNDAFVEDRGGEWSGKVKTSSFVDGIEEISSSTRNIKDGIFFKSTATLSGVLNDEECVDYNAYAFKEDLRNIIISIIRELRAELDNTLDPIVHQALEHIHAHEVVLLFGASRTCVEFLLQAHHKKRPFDVFVAETTAFHGHAQARALADGGVSATLISDAAVFALMSRVNKVLIGAHAALANGGVISTSGAFAVAAAAARHSVPVVCVMGLYKLSPIHPHDLDVFAELSSPGNAVAFGALPARGSVEVLAPAQDYIPPERIALFVTNTGGYDPSYVYRLLSEFYHPTDSISETSIFGTLT